MEDKEKIGKKIIFTIIIIAILLLTVTFSTYAFFNYSRTGARNQRLVTGRIKLEFTEGTNNVNLSNQFPISDADAVAMTTAGSEVVITDFVVSGYAGGATTLRYQVSAIAGNTITGMNRMPDENIKLYLTVNTNSVGTAAIGNGYGTASGGVYGALASEGREVDTGSGGEIVLAQGQVATTDTTHNYTMRMWISDTVTISDTDSTKTYCASTAACNDSRTVYNTLYYSLRIRVSNLDI